MLPAKSLIKKILSSILPWVILSGCGFQEFRSLKETENMKSAGAQCRPSKSSPFLSPGPYQAKKTKVLVNSIPSKTKNLIPQESRSLTVTLNRECELASPDETVMSQVVRPEGPELESYQVDVEGDSDMLEVLRDLEDDPCVLFVGDANVMKTSALDPALSDQLHLAAIGVDSVVEEIYNPESGVTQDVVVAVIDTGIDSGHQDLQENMWVNPLEIPGNGLDDDENGYTDDVNGFNFVGGTGRQDPTSNRQNHGTHVAGLTGAGYDNGIGGAGILGQHIKLMGLNVFGENNGAQNADIENAIRYAADNGADVINMSLGGCGYTPTTGQAISYALEKGVVVIVAAGNEAQALSPNPEDGINCNFGGPVFSSPGSFSPSFPGMLTIGSVEASNISARSIFSNYGPEVLSLMAPGSERTQQNIGLYSTDVGNRYTRLIGTSMAAPVVAGAAAVAIGLLKSRGYMHTPKDIEELLTDSAQAFGGLSPFVQGGKSLDVQGLVSLVNQLYPAQTETLGETPPGEDPMDPLSEESTGDTDDGRLVCGSRRTGQR